MKFKLAFALHNHQPVGNFSAVFEESHKKCYLPFLKLLKKHPGIRISLHQSGILWNWQKENYFDFFKMVGELVDRDQIELLSGGFYEPILCSIPDPDKIAQIKKLSRFIADHFESTPRGMWLAERVWEPQLPRTISQAGIEYLPLDDTHFKYAGLEEDQLYGTYITEEAGKTLTLLPIIQKLRYLIPFGTPEEIIDFLREAARRHPGAMAVYADDGEKFGGWPKTYKHCYQDGWLEKFFSLLEENSDWLEVIPLREAVESSRPLGRIYLPTASYSEMLHWALPSSSFVAYEEFEEKLKDYELYREYGRFVRGGHWRGFLAKYPESNLIHKKMLAVSELHREISQIPDIDESELDRAADMLYAGQCNDAYWHGVFGGLYLSHLRWALYRRLIEAEKILRKISDKQKYFEITDRDGDGSEEIAVGGEDVSMVLAPAHGGQIIELVSLENKANIADCLTRRREGYHRKLINAEKSGEKSSTKSIHDIVATKEKGLEKLLVEDWYLRRPLTDHFLAGDTGLKDFADNRYTELGDFILEPFESDIDEDSRNYYIRLSRHGHVWQGDFHCPLFLEKRLIFPKSGHNIGIEYRMVQEKLEILPVKFGIEFDFNLLAPDARDRYAEIDGSRPSSPQLAGLGCASKASRIDYIDEYQNIGIGLESDRPGQIWRLPIYTVSLSEGGFEKVFQGNCTLFVFEKALSAGEEFSFKMNLFVGPLDRMKKDGNRHQQKAEKI